MPDARPDLDLSTVQNLQNLPIGLFDSGVGGLTVLKALRNRLPAEDTLYLGDTARLPYGTKSAETIVRYALKASARLVAMRVKLLVVACNTVSAVALPALAAAFPDLPVIGVVEPGAEAACAATTHGRIAVIATESTVRGGAYSAAILRRQPHAQVLSCPCPLFVPLAEEGWFNGPIAESVAERYLGTLFHVPQFPDTLVLGCTHYPLLTNAIRTVIGPVPTLVDSAATTAEAVAHRLNHDNTACRQNRQGHARFCTTDDTARFARVGSLFLEEELKEKDVELVDI